MPPISPQGEASLGDPAQQQQQQQDDEDSVCYTYDTSIVKAKEEQGPSEIDASTAASRDNREFEERLVAVTLPPIVHAKWYDISVTADPRRNVYRQREYERFKRFWGRPENYVNGLPTDDVASGGSASVVIAGANANSRPEVVRPSSGESQQQQQQQQPRQSSETNVAQDAPAIADVAVTEKNDDTASPTRKHRPQENEEKFIHSAGSHLAPREEEKPRENREVDKVTMNTPRDNEDNKVAAAARRDSSPRQPIAAGGAPGTSDGFAEPQKQPYPRDNSENKENEDARDTTPIVNASSRTVSSGLALSRKRQSQESEVNNVARNVMAIADANSWNASDSGRVHEHQSRGSKEKKKDVNPETSDSTSSRKQRSEGSVENKIAAKTSELTLSREPAKPLNDRESIANDTPKIAEATAPMKNNNLSQSRKLHSRANMENIAPNTSDVTPSKVRRVVKEEHSIDLLELSNSSTVDKRCHVGREIPKCKESSPKKNVGTDTVDVDRDKLLAGTRGPSESTDKPEVNDASESRGKSKIPASTTTAIPELLDEVVGSCIFPLTARSSRNSIKLNLSCHRPPEAKNDRPLIEPAPDSRIPDSVVSVEEDHPAQNSAVKLINGRDRAEERCATKRPRVIDVVTCAKGTLFDMSTLSNRSKPTDDSHPEAKKSKSDDETTEQQEWRSRTVADSPGAGISDAKTEKKLRVRKKLRVLFGNALGSVGASDSTELNSLTPRTNREKRKSRASCARTEGGRQSSDSGLSTDDLTASERVSVSPDVESRVKQLELLGGPLPTVQEVTAGNSIEKEEKSCGPRTEKPSMPLLDVSPMKWSDGALAETLPDSVVDSVDNVETNRVNDTVKKFTILITPVNTLGPDTFAPVCMEIDALSGELLSAVESTMGPPGNENFAKLEAESKTADIATIAVSDGAITGQTKCELNGANTSGTDDSSVRRNDSDVTTASYNSKTIDSIETRQTITSSNAERTRDTDDKAAVEFPASSDPTTSQPSVLETRRNDEKLDFKDSPDRRTVIHSAEDDIKREILSKSKEDNTRELLQLLKCTAELGEIAIKVERPEDGELEEEEIAMNDTPSTAMSVESEDPVRAPSPAEPPANTRENASPPKALPSVRLIHHSELGSRWCPTPLIADAPTTNQPEKMSKMSTSEVLSSQPVSSVRPIAVTENSAPEAIVPPDHVHNVGAFSSTNGCEIREKNPANLHTNNSVGQTTKNSPSATVTTDGDSNECLKALYIKIFMILADLQWCVEKCKTAEDAGRYDEYQTLFLKKKQQLVTLCGTRDSSSVENIAKYAIEIFEHSQPSGGRIFNLEKIRYILRSKVLPPPVNFAAEHARQNAQMPAKANYYRCAAPAEAPGSRQPPLVSSKQKAFNPPSQQCHGVPASQPELAAPHPKPTVAAAAPARTPPSHLFSPAQWNTFLEQVKVYRDMCNASIRGRSKEISVRDKLNATKNTQRTDNQSAPKQWQISREQPELRQSSSTVPRQREVARTESNVVYGNPTFILPPPPPRPPPPPYDGNRLQIEPRLTCIPMNNPYPARGAIPYGKIPQSSFVPLFPSPMQQLQQAFAFNVTENICRQAKVPVSMMNINAQQVLHQNLAIATQKFAAHEYGYGYSQANAVPIFMANANMQQQLQHSLPISSQKFATQNLLHCGNCTGVPTYMGITDAQVQQLMNNSASNQQNSLQELVAGVNSTKSIGTANTAGAQLQPRLSCAATVQHIAPEKSVPDCCRNNPVSMHNINRQPELGPSAAAPIRKTIRQTVLLGNSSSSTKTYNTGAQPELPMNLSASSQRSLVQQLNYSVNSTNITSTASAVGGQLLKPLWNPATTIQQTTSDESNVNNEINIPVSTPSSDARLALQPTPAVPIDETTTRETVRRDKSRSPAEINSTVEQTESPKTASPPSQRSLSQQSNLSLNSTNIAAARNATDVQLKPLWNSTVEEITPEEPVRSDEDNQVSVSVKSTDAQQELREIAAAAPIEEIAAEAPVLRVCSTIIPTDKDSVESVGELPESRSSPDKRVQEKKMYDNSKIEKKSLINGCKSETLDALEEMDGGPMKKKEASPHLIDSTSPPVATIVPIDVAVTSDVNKDEIQVSDVENNNNCASCQNDDSESISPLPMSEVSVITINDSDDDDNDNDNDYSYAHASLTSSFETSEDFKYAGTVGKAEDETAEVGVSSENVEVTGEAIDESMCKTVETLGAVEDELTATFNILEVRSISKELFNNMEDSSGNKSPRMQEPMKVDGDIDIEEDAPPSCCRCGLPSSVVCERCYSAYYCSAECHKSHWTEIHHMCCKLVPEKGPTPL